MGHPAFLMLGGEIIEIRNRINGRDRGGMTAATPLTFANIEPRGAFRSDGALVVDNLPSRTGLMRRGSVVRARIAPSHEEDQIVM